MFMAARGFNQPLGEWDVSSVTDMNRMFLFMTLSTANYDNLLAGWAALSLQSGVDFHGGNSQYTNNAARQYIIDTFGWTIEDGGSATASSQTTSFQNSDMSSSKSDASDSNFLQFSVFLLSIVSIAIIQRLRKNRSFF
jgi:surface protein